jgi:CubicO group peptidase (beta-lactamase class C family)
MLGHKKDIPKTARELGLMQGFPPPPEMRPTLENWDLPPFNRWSFQNMRSLFPTANVSRGTGAVHAFRTDPQDLTNIRFESVDGRSISVANWIQESYTDGLLVMHNGTSVFEQYQNDMGPLTPHLSQSVAKSLVGTLAGVLHAEGLFDLKAPLGDLVPELIGTGYGDCPMDTALDMLSGVTFSEDYNIPNSGISKVDIASGWRPLGQGETRPTIRDVILSLPKEKEHGLSFSYRSIETDVVAWALERAANQDLCGMLSDRIWQKLGCEQDASFTVDAAGTALADGGFNATLRDYARFAQMMQDSGRVDDVQVVPEKWVNSILKGAEPAKFGEPYTKILPDGAYRRFWWVRDVKKQIFMARGVFGQLLYIDRSANLTVTKLSSWPDYVMPAFSHDLLRACDAIARSLGSD